MALVFCDSFDHYATAQMQQKWTTLVNSPTISGAGGRFGTGSLLFDNGSKSITKTLASQATYIVGVAVKFTGAIGSGAKIVGVLDTGTLHVDVRTNGSNQLQVTRNGTVLGTGTFVLAGDVWYFIEFKATIHDTTGTAVVRINGITDINLSSQDTRNGANSTANQVRLGDTLVANYDDLYVCDTTGSAPQNDFLGDVRVQNLLPSGNGNSSVLVGSDGNSTDNYLLVDEATPNDDSDYVESSTVGDKDTYAYGNLTPTAGTVYGVQVIPWAKKTDAGTRSIVSVARLSATEVDSADKALSATYTYLPDIRETKPGGGAWSISDVNSAEFGVKVTA